MNVDNIRTTIESIRRSETFDQNTFDHDCGTPGCIVGHALVDAGFDLNDAAVGRGIMRNETSQWFGIDPDLVIELFNGYRDEEEMPITKEDAIAVLENLIETGKVDWRVAHEY